ncbi:hypothetical protein EDC65_0716 [Stella humosa]|uniref:Uncharacterized protein n=1 Tax=Stella humosa TaxID=94 RepID=A0A3N1MKM1_9PROT|nr:hypothetical protein [Stella humosa]ROQ01536.1 hypothetical protein EDC65_0716 [Stella humosa]BBK31916.1 hypothetical protein STHU_25500 [Stella humosa]
MPLTPTAIGFGVSAATLVFGMWHDRRPWQPGKLSPFWMLFAGTTGCLVFGIHLFNLLLR